MQELTEPQKIWIAALRSGKYQQGRGALNSENKFCCLGVACEVFKEDLKLDVLTVQESTVSYDGVTADAPTKVVDHLGLFGTFGSANPDEKKTGSVFLYGLASLNDRGTTFAEIADILEQQPERYFRPPCKS